MVTVLALDGLTKKHFGHYALLKIFSLRSPREEEVDAIKSGVNVDEFALVSIQVSHKLEEIGGLKLKL